MTAEGNTGGRDPDVVVLDRTIMAHGSDHPSGQLPGLLGT
jgi:hypothetical protein